MTATTSLWRTVDRVCHGRAESIIREAVTAGDSFDQIARRLETYGAFVSREWVRQQAKRIGAERSA